MKSLLVINASGRVTRSITRHLTNCFVKGWSSRNPGAEILARDVGVNPPPPVDELWIAAAFAAPTERTAEMHRALALSETMIDEIVRSEAIVIGVPMYNFGMPAQLKAYVDQIVRVGRTFDFDSSESNPYRPLLSSKPTVLITATGAGGYEPGGPSAHLNFVEPHLEAVFSFIGLTDISFVHVGFEELKNDQFKRSIADAEFVVEKILDRMAAKQAPNSDSRKLIPSH